MPKVFNLHGDVSGIAPRIDPAGGARTPGSARHIGSELIGGSMYELEPGDRLWPYHTHHANEEWLLVVRGQPTLRTPEGETELQRGRRRRISAWRRRCCTR